MKPRGEQEHTQEGTDVFAIENGGFSTDAFASNAGGAGAAEGNAAACFRTSQEKVVFKIKRGGLALHAQKAPVPRML